MAIKSSAKYTGFVIFNWLLISVSIYLFTPGKNQPFEPVFLSMYFAALLIIIAQYPALVSATSWKAKILIFYISMVIFLAIVGFTFTWNESVGANAAGTWAARFDGAFRFIFFGHFFGAWSLPFVVFVNWLLKNWFFEPSPSVNQSISPNT